MEYTLYTKDNCPHCSHAKQLLQSKGHTYTELKVPDQADREMIQERVHEAGSAQVVRTVPQIFLADEYIGTLEMLKKHLT